MRIPSTPANVRDAQREVERQERLVAFWAAEVHAAGLSGRLDKHSTAKARWREAVRALNSARATVAQLEHAQASQSKALPSRSFSWSVER